MNRYAITVRSMSGDPHDITILHKDVMTNEQLMDKFDEIIASEGISRDGIDYRHEVQEKFFQSLPKYGFIFQPPEYVATADIELLCMTKEERKENGF